MNAAPIPARAVHLAEQLAQAEMLLIEPSGTPNTGGASTAARRIEI